MNKLLLVIPLIALVSTGVYIFNHKTELMGDEDIFLEPASNPGCGDVTFSQWKTCIAKSKIGQCDFQKTEQQKSSCYSASYLSTLQMWPDVSTSFCPCRAFWEFYNVAQSNSNLNWNDLYRRCFTKLSLIKAASKDDYYYDHIYAPQYLLCAGLKKY